MGSTGQRWRRRGRRWRRLNGGRTSTGSTDIGDVMGGRHRRDRPTTSVRSAMALTRWREDVDGVRRRRGRDEESPSTRCPQCVDARAKRGLPAVRCRRRYGWGTSTERTEVEDAAARSLSRGGVQTSRSAKMTSVRSCSPPSASALARAKSASLFPRSRTCERWSVEFYE